MAPTLTQKAVHYRQGTLEEHCGNCVMFTLTDSARSTGKCDLVRGVIDAPGVCDRWEAREGDPRE